MHEEDAVSAFAGKVVLITGASSGIGAAAARAFAKKGAQVALVARNVTALEKIAGEISRDGGTALPVPADVGEAASRAALVDRVVAELGGIDVLVNNAGTNHRGPVEERSPGELAEIVTVNLIAPILLTRAVLPQLRRRGGGAIVNVASLAGRVPLPDEATYSATKFALRAFSFAIADELSGSGIRVSVVSPGPVDTGFIMSDLENVPDLVFSQPMSTAEEIAQLIVASAADGRREVTPSRVSSVMTTLAYLFPALRRAATPLMEKRGHRAKDVYLKRAREH